jgi:hypothetical protein
MEAYSVIFIIVGAFICICAPLFGRLAKGILVSAGIKPSTRPLIENLFKGGILLFGIFCIFVGVVNLVSGVKIISA